jgi:uncharacterized membrane protein YbhN (UPF0104 family)
VGFLFVLAPAGAGVREVVLVATLTPMLGGDAGAATAIALVSRLVTVLADLIGAAAAGAFGLHAAKGAPAQDPVALGH